MGRLPRFPADYTPTGEDLNHILAIIDSGLSNSDPVTSLTGDTLNPNIPNPGGSFNPGKGNVGALTVPRGLSGSSGIDNYSQTHTAYVLLSWTPNPIIDFVTRYDVYYHKGSERTLYTQSVGGSLSSTRINNLFPGNIYSFSVKATDAAGRSSSWCPEIDIPISLDIDPPAVPTGLTATGTTMGVLLNWTEVGTEGLSNDLKGYEIEVSGAYSSTVIADGPVSYWRLGEPSGSTVADSVSTNIGTITPTVTLAVAGGLLNDVDTAATFDGVAGFVTVTSVSALHPGDTFSIEFLINTTTSSVSSLIHATTNLDFRVNLNASGQIQLLRIGAGLDTAMGHSTTSVNDGIWHHCVVTKATSTIKFYVDGVDVTGALSNLTITAGSGNIIFGKKTSTQFFAGSLDEIAIYNYALTSTQVANHQVATTYLTYHQGPTSYYFHPFTGISSQSASPTLTFRVASRDWTGNISAYTSTVSALAASPAFAVNSRGVAQAASQVYPGAEAGLATQVSGGLLHSTGVPSNSNGNNNDWCISDNGHVYFKSAGSWAQKV